MKVITSRDNPFFKRLKQLASQSTARLQQGLTLLDGVHLCEAYLTHVGQPQACVVSETAQHHPEVRTLLASVSSIFILPESLYASLSQVENGVGIFFVIPIPTWPVPSQIEQTAVILEALQDPGNMGSLLRSAAAAGIQSVFCSERTVSAWAPKVMRAAMGAHFVLKIYENIDILAVLNRTRICVLATSSHARDILYECHLNQPIVWLFGHEGRGLSPPLMAYADKCVAIPHVGRLESLNVAASGAICFFEQVRQCQQNNREYGKS